MQLLPDVSDVRRVLVERVKDVCRFLLPRGREDGERWVVGNWNGVEGSSLTVDLAGEFAGKWRDWKPDDEAGTEGDLIDLWCHVRGCRFREALKEIWVEFGRKAGVSRGWESLHSERVAGGWLDDCAALGLRAPAADGAMAAWLTQKYRVQLRNWPNVMERDGKDGLEACFEYRNEVGLLAGVRCVDIGSGRSWMWPERMDRCVLFGSDALEPTDDCLLLVKSEMDVLALEQLTGRRAVALPRQTKSAGDVHRWMEDQGQWVAGFKRVYFVFGMKEEERPAWETLAARLGEDRVMRVILPDGKMTVHECLIHGVTGDAVEKAFAGAGRLEPSRLVRPTDVRERILDLYFPDERQVEQGDPLPYRFPADFRFRPGELTIWHGYTGSGKTQVLNNCLVYWARECSRRICVASLEVDAADTFWYQGRIYSGKRRPETEEEFNGQLAWLNAWVSAYYHVGAAPLDDVFRIFEYEAKRRGAWHFVLDSLMRVEGVKSDDYDAQKAVCDRCIEFARRFRCHVHMVAHSKKPDARHPPERCWPGMYDISGSAALANLPHGIVCVWRNRGKENAFKEAEYLMGAEREELLAKWRTREDSLLIVQKNRKTGGEGEKRLWFDSTSVRFREEQPTMAEDWGPNGPVGAPGGETAPADAGAVDGDLLGEEYLGGGR